MERDDFWKIWIKLSSEFSLASVHFFLAHCIHTLFVGLGCQLRFISLGLSVPLIIYPLAHTQRSLFLLENTVIKAGVCKLFFYRKHIIHPEPCRRSKPLTKKFKRRSCVTSNSSISCHWSDALFWQIQDGGVEKSWMFGKTFEKSE